LKQGSALIPLIAPGSPLKRRRLNQFDIYPAGGRGGTPSLILNPRMLRLILQFKF